MIERCDFLRPGARDDVYPYLLCIWLLGVHVGKMIPLLRWDAGLVSWLEKRG